MQWCYLHIFGINYIICCLKQLNTKIPMIVDQWLQDKFVSCNVRFIGTPSRPPTDCSRFDNVYRISLWNNMLWSRIQNVMKQLSCNQPIIYSYPQKPLRRRAPSKVSFVKLASREPWHGIEPQGELLHLKVFMFGTSFKFVPHTSHVIHK